VTTNKELLEIRENETPRGVGTQTTVFSERALNAELWDVEGKRYIDLASGIAVTNTGHNHPAVIAAVRAQLERFSHTCFQVTPYDVYVRLAQRLNRLAPGASRKKTIFLTTGAEAVENAVKIARKHTGRTAVVAFSGAFHGRTMMGMALTGKVVPYKAGFGPFPAEVYHVPFPVTYHGTRAEDSLAALDSLFRSDVEPSRVAAMIVEPVQGEGGFYPAPLEFLRALREICDTHGIVLVVDEIQTGFARTGKLFAIEHAGVEPDLMPVAKSLAGGFPLSGVIGKADIMDAPAPGGLGGTYGGSPLGCAAGLAVLDVIEKEQLCDKAVAIGEQIRAWAEPLKARNDAVGDVRITGAMSAIEFVQDGDPDRPDPALTRAVAAKALEEGVLLLTCGVRGNVIRFLPALTIAPELLAEALDTVGRVIDDLT
jgi:4-aminobutyrate aminotransferase